MTTSTNSDDNIQSVKAAGGAFAVWKGWQPVEAGGIDMPLTLLASALFAIAAFTDIFDDFLGGNSRSLHRRFGYLDDIADTVLVAGTLAILVYVVHRAGWMSWVFLTPVVILIGREIIVGLLKGFELSRYVLPNTLMSNLKSGLSMLGTCLLLASPWLQVWIDRLRADVENVAGTFAEASPIVWVTGEVILWIAALFSILSAIALFKADFSAANDA